MVITSTKLIDKVYHANNPEEAFDRVFQGIMRDEGNYITEGKTEEEFSKYGITLYTARLFGYKGTLSTFTVGMAKDIYKKGYWDSNRVSDIYKISPTIAIEMFEIGINLSPIKAAIWTQRLCNSLNTIKGGKYKFGDDLLLDGVISNTTIKRLAQMSKKDHKIIYNGINAMHRSYYITNAYIKPTFRQRFVDWCSHKEDLTYDAKTSITDQTI
jgi:lysozyme family protein